MPKLELTIPTEVLSEEAKSCSSNRVGHGGGPPRLGPAAATDGEGLPA